MNFILVIRNTFTACYLFYAHTFNLLPMEGNEGNINSKQSYDKPTWRMREPERICLGHFIETRAAANKLTNKDFRSIKVN